MNPFRLVGIIVLMMLSSLAGFVVLAVMLISTLMHRERKNAGTTRAGRRAFELELRDIEADLRAGR